ncbi:MAG: hypothetical protein ACSHXY_04165 [Alphaproteobacteria bacterium]
MSARLENKLGGRTKKAGLGLFMRPGLILALLLISVFSLGALITLSGFAGDLRSKDNGGAHALSNSAIGYGGLVQLLRADDMEITLDRSADGVIGRADKLRVITLSRPYQFPKREDVSAELSTLIVLPKWYVVETKERSGWVRQLPKPIGPTYGQTIISKRLDDFSEGLSMQGVSIDDGTYTYDFRSREKIIPQMDDVNIRYLQSLKGDGLIPILRAGDEIILGRIKDTSNYILSDPDILNTMGISQKRRARFARDLVKSLVSLDGVDDHEIIFDLNIHGFGRTQNLVKTLLTPPFLAATLCLLAAGALIGWQAFARFGDPVREERDYELGKYTLADNGARFIAIAGKETGMGAGYKQLMRRLAAKAFFMERQSQESIDAYFEEREKQLGIEMGWRKRAHNVEHADTKLSFLRAAKALHKWKQEITHDGK